MILLREKFKYKIACLISRIYCWADSTILAEKKLELEKSLKYCGTGVHFHGQLKITFPENIELNDNVVIGNNAYLDGRGGIIIGENTHISRNFVVHSSSHNYKSKRLPYDCTYDLKPVIIGRNVWIGTNVVLIPGISIGDGAIIGAGTVVSKSVPELAIVGNQPIRIIKHRDKEHYQNLDKNKCYGGISGRKLLKNSTNIR